MNLSLVICTYNRRRILEQTLPSFLGLDVPDELCLQLIVVDNNSSDDTKGLVEQIIVQFEKEKKRISIKYIFEEKQGLSHARNKGYAESNGEYIAYIDDECILPRDWLNKAHKIIKSENPAFLGGPYLGKYMKSSKSRWFNESFGDSYILQYELPNGPMKGRYLSGGNMFIRRDIFEKIGMFNTELGMSGNIVNYGEEVEFQKRYIEAFPNGVIWYDSSVFLWHLIRDEKMTMSFLLKDALIRGKSAAELKKLSKRKLYSAPFHLIFFTFKALFSAFKNGLLSLITRQHYFLLLYNDYKNGTWRDVGASWYKTKKLLGL